SGRGLVEVRWVFVHDVQGTHRDEYFFTTDVSLSPEQVVTWYTGRWSIEVTFQEARAHLGLSTTRQWARDSVLRAFPCLLGLFSLVALAYAQHVKRGGKARPLGTPWYAKPHVTFSDAIATVRRLLWRQTVLKHPL